MAHLCESCDEPATRRCSGCKVPTAWYCSEECQRTLWGSHIFECNPTKPINTAYHLARAVYGDQLPDDPQTCEDYGFTRAFTPENRSNLLGLYQGLITYQRVEPKTIHRWRVKGRLIEEIKAAYEKLPPDKRGGYYPWLLQNEWVINQELPAPTDAAHEMMLRAWKYAGGSSASTQEVMAAEIAGWSERKRACFGFCASLLSGWHPSPELNIWLQFGFCACADEYAERSLAERYRQLIAMFVW